MDCHSLVGAQVLRYETNQHYWAHADYFDPQLYSEPKYMDRPTTLCLRAVAKWPFHPPLQPFVPIVFRLNGTGC